MAHVESLKDAIAEATNKAKDVQRVLDDIDHIIMRAEIDLNEATIRSHIYRTVETGMRNGIPANYIFAIPKGRHHLEHVEIQNAINMLRTQHLKGTVVTMMDICKIDHNGNSFVCLQGISMGIIGDEQCTFIHVTEVPQESDDE